MSEKEYVVSPNKGVDYTQFNPRNGSSQLVPGDIQQDPRRSRC